MKLLLILSSIFMTVNSYAAPTCDLNVSVSRLKDVKTTAFITDDWLSDNDKSLDYLEDLLDSHLLKKCADQGATNCKITKRDNKFDVYQASYTVYATVQGTIVKGGKKLSDNEYAKERQKAICEKVDTCINDALNDEETSTNFMEKLFMVKDKNNCNQIESFLFSK